MSKQSVFHKPKSKNSPLKALFLNCTIKPSSEVSHTKALMDRLASTLEQLDNVEVEIVHVLDYNVQFGVQNDMGNGDEWPQILEKIKTCNIFIMGMPIWMGVRSSVAQMVIERLDGSTKEGGCPDTGQFPLYGSVAGVVVTGNEDGAHDCVANTFANLLHFGVTIPPNTDVYWVGDAGPGMSYIDAGGELSPYVERNIMLTAQNLIFGAKLLQKHPYPTNIKELNQRMMKKTKVKNKLQNEMNQKLRVELGELERV